MEQKFFICPHCGNIIAKVNDSGVPVVCCGQPMTQILPNTTDAATEKHVPVVKRNKTIVEVVVGETLHPMTNEHNIAWVSIQTKQGNQRKVLQPNAAPTVSFFVDENDEIEAVYAYCNLHGLWKA